MADSFAYDPAQALCKSKARVLRRERRLRGNDGGQFASTFQQLIARNDLVHYAQLPGLFRTERLLRQTKWRPRMLPITSGHSRFTPSFGAMPNALCGMS
jgi:hypothetical protein